MIPAQGVSFDLPSLRAKVRTIFVRWWHERVPQAEMGRRIGVKQPTVSIYKDGKRLPEADVLARLCKERDISPAWLLFEVGPERLSDLQAALPTASPAPVGIPDGADFHVR